MNSDDVIYISLLIASTLFGAIHRQINDVRQRKIVGSLVGVAIVLVVCGVQILHPALCFLVNVLILKYGANQYRHVFSFAYSFMHLLLFRTWNGNIPYLFNLGLPNGHTNLVQMLMTLKLVGIAFEIVETGKDLAMFDVFHYAFNYVGILTGPYYTYKTYEDFIVRDHYKRAQCLETTLSKLRAIPIFVVMFLTLGHYWPISYALTEAFYADQSVSYRLWYTIPTILWYRSRIYIGMILSECVCTMAGLGAYPVSMLSRPGQGPTKIEDAREKSIEYNFETIQNIKPLATEQCVTVRETMKNWNMCVQYWLYRVVYGRFPIKKYRLVATFLISAFWHGLHIGYYCCICGVALYLPVENLYSRLLPLTLSSNFANLILWTMKTLAFAYLGFAFQLLTFEHVLRYYASVYHFGLLLFLGLFVIGKFFVRTR